MNIFCLGEYFFPDFSTNLESIRKGGERKEKNTFSQCLEREQGWCLKTNEEDKTMISITVSIPQSLHT